jgi:hypothetical protein
MAALSAGCVRDFANCMTDSGAFVLCGNEWATKWCSQRMGEAAGFVSIRLKRNR